MKTKELQGLIRTSYNQVGTYGRDAARIYHAVVELDGQVLDSKKVIQRESAWVNERGGVIAFLVGELARISGAQSLDEVRAISEGALAHVDSWHAAGLGSHVERMDDKAKVEQEAESVRE